MGEYNNLTIEAIADELVIRLRNSPMIGKAVFQNNYIRFDVSDEFRICVLEFISRKLNQNCFESKLIKEFNISKLSK